MTMGNGMFGVLPWFDSKAPGRKAILDKCEYAAPPSMNDEHERQYAAPGSEK